jgi:hypothetical protein
LAATGNRWLVSGIEMRLMCAVEWRGKRKENSSSEKRQNANIRTVIIAGSCQGLETEAGLIHLDLPRPSAAQHGTAQHSTVW